MLANHSELILAAGGTPNEPKRKIPDPELFGDYAKVCRREGKIPTQKRLRSLTRELGTRTYKVEKPDGYPAFKARFREWCRRKSPEYDDILGFTGWERNLPRGRASRRSSAKSPRFPTCICLSG